MKRFEERGISPVVGTILLIGVTVALAAIVTTMVGGLGGGGAPPSAQLAVTTDVSSDNLVISHEGGDDVVFSEIKIRVENNGSENVAKIPSENIGGVDSTLTVGESVNIDVDNAIEGGFKFNPGDVLTVYIIHKPSGQKIYSNESLTVS